MTYSEALDFIYSRRKFAKSNGLERISALLEKLGSVQNELKFVHVVGTNGKGSVSTMISSVLSAAGYKTGLFTSPFVTDFRERIQIDKRYISEESFCEICSEVKKVCESLEKENLLPTFFETVLAVALVYFKRENCDIVILEAGIGGRDDSTNIIPAPIAVAITSVSFDHVEILGNTLTQIANAKCAVIKSGASVVSFPENNGSLDFVAQQKETVEVIKNTCKEKNCRLVIPDASKVGVISEKLDRTVFSYNGRKIKMRFSGQHQIGNALLALSVIDELKEKGFEINEEDIEKGFETAFIPARMEVISKEPLVLVDGGHNEGCMRALSKLITKHLKEKKITAVLGFMKDKDYESSINIIAPLCENIVFTLADRQRGEDPKVLESCALGLCKNIYIEENIALAFEKSKKLTGKNDVIICAGSFYLVSEIRKNF